MSRQRDRLISTGAVYACVSAVYLLYLPHALPVLDDWTIFEIFSNAWAAGPMRALAFVWHIIDNSWWGQFRFFWGAFLPIFALSPVARFAAWPYLAFALAAHICTAVLLYLLLDLLSGQRRLAFAAGAIFCVFPPCNNILFWAATNPAYYLQTLALSYWLYGTWKKVSTGNEPEFTWRDVARALPAAFTGEQGLPALLLLGPVTSLLFGRRARRRRESRFWLLHGAAIAALLLLYAIAINREPIRAGFRNRFPDVASGSISWRPLPFVLRLFAALGLRPRFAEWRPSWALDSLLAGFVLLAVAAFLWRWFRTEPGEARGAAAPRGLLRLLVWSACGAILTYLPVALLPTIEWRYLYVPALFLVSGGAALTALQRNAWLEAGMVAAVIAYFVGLTYCEIRQCWIPESREAQAIIRAVTSSKVERDDVVILAHSLYNIGPAPAFITGASWAENGMLRHYTGSAAVEGARELLVNERGDLALYRRDSNRLFHRQALLRLRVFQRAADGTFVAMHALALPAAGGGFTVFPLRPFTDALAAGPPITREQLEALPYFKLIYFAHPVRGPLP